MILKREMEKVQVLTSQRDMLLDFIQRYIKSFVQELKDHCLEQSEDKERTQSSRKVWKSLHDELEKRMWEIGQLLDRVEKLERTYSEEEQRYSDQKKILMDGKNGDIKETLDSIMSQYKDHEDEEHDKKYEITS